MKMQREPRYEVEQYLLPKELYTSGPMLLSKIIGDANPVMRDFYARAGEESIRYSFEETHRVYYRDDCSVLVIRIGMPEPEHDHLSRAVYLCYCDRNGENLYFMSELAADGRYLLCCRPDSERIRHMLCKDAPEDDSTEFDIVADLYGELVIKDGLKQLESVCAS